MLEISQKLGGGEGMGVRPNTLYTPRYFLNYGYISWSKIAKLYSEEVSTEHPQEIHSWMHTFSSIVLLNVETMLLALMDV
jgi:hypothetical protein